ncbi:uncharacterized protein MONOS_7027 [Monocercomonoides exilis]|uniref:uncharacterized protein n=1 Tax=Monocercomonoides exilis TaxID=2049356 RepID=UPI003559B7E7|nr:hypothetical protein MONOS_7027 [Monocercomonoides exilis]|eukprot:MONOS_7027.1-p1 / transcript=MONOS_7027.1 / gene=MONOS_7027 / organism=Monocercomonoides_exilis_PA203 / gene_product=unspecified product / transcript_product=unspecified product / location=Mono_scaffold00231:73987-79256(-) / protein_length=1669 / sequence_SO=supercontig / SO=protein_coding / is_pseudo=false
MQNCKSEDYAPSKIDKYGHDIHIGHFQQWMTIGENNISECYSSSASPRITKCNDGFYACSDISDMSSWLKDNENNHQVTVDYSVGIDHEQCGFAPFCRSIKYSLKRTTSNSNKTLILRPSVFKEEQISISSSEFSVCGLSKNECVVQSASSLQPVFDISSGAFCVKKVTTLQGNAESGESKPFVVMDGDGSLTMEECEISSVESKLQLEVSFMCIFGGNVELSGVGITGKNFLSDSLISFNVNQSGSVLHVVNTNFTLIQRLSGSGGIIERCDTSTGIVIVENCHFENVPAEKDGGGLAMRGEWKGELIVNGTSMFEGCCAGTLEEKGRGGGLFISVDSTDSEFTVCENVIFSEENKNRAFHGSDVFVQCESGLLLEEIINQTSFGFFKDGNYMNNEEKLCGCEDGASFPVIPLFVYLCTMGTKVIVDGSGGNGKDHNHCGFDEFRCLTVDYCANSRLSESSKEIEVVSSSSITKEITGPSFDVIITGRIESLEEERMQVNVSDGGSATQDWLVGCSSSLTMSRLSFVVKGQLNSRRKAFILSNSTLSVTNCSVSFESGALTDGKIGYNVINIEGGGFIMNGFVMEGSVTMNGKSPISMSEGMRLEILNSRVSGVEVEVEGGIGGGCLNFVMKEEGGSVCIEESNISSRCSGGSGMKGGGMMISVGNGGSLEMKKVNLSECEVPSEDSEEGGRGMGGGMFVELPNQMGTFVLEGMTFEGCNAWKGKNAFVSGWNLSEVVNKENFKWEMSSEELESLDELCGWERKTTGEEGYVIPLVVYLWSNWSGNGFVSKERGRDFSGCGFSEVPCSSIEHLISLRYEPLGEGESHINIVGTGALNRGISFPSPPSLTETPIVTIEGEKKGTVLKVREMDGNEESESMVVSNVHLSFKNISFTMPNELGRHSSFIQSSSSSAILSVVSCSIDCSEEMREMKYCVVKVDGGSLAIEDFTLSELSVAKGFVEEERNANTVVRVNESTFTNISCGENGACVVSVDSFGVGVECVVEGCVLTKCVSERSEEGGGVKMCLKSGESELKVRGCSLVMCMCSTADGRGGGMMIDAVDPKAESVEKEMPALGVRLENIRFVMNEAFVGKDVFIKCYSIAGQVNETLFVLDFSQDALKSNNSICGRDDVDKVDVDLIPLITFYYSEQVFLSVNGSESRQCGAQEKPCQSICCGARHIERSVANMILIDGECLIGGVCEIRDLNVKSLKRAQAAIHLNTRIEEDEMNGGSVIVFVDECVVERCGFVFGEMFGWDGESIVKEKDGRLEISECLFSSATMDLVMKSRIVCAESGELKMTETTFDGIHTTAPLLSFTKEGKVSMSEISIWDVTSECGLICVGGSVQVEMTMVEGVNISVLGNESVMKMEGAEKRMSVLNCSFAQCQGTNERGRMVEICECVDVLIGSCLFDGGKKERNEQYLNDEEEMCRWDGSLVDISNSSVLMKDTTLLNSPEGGITMSEGNVTIEKGEFIDNNLSIEGYPSMRRNIICSDSGTLNVMSLKGGDGWERNTSLWMLNEGCSFEGITSERDSSFFIPVLESAEAKEEADRMKLIFKGMLLVPCNLSFSVVKRKGEEKEIEKHDFDSNGFLSEREVEGSVAKDLISGCGNDVEVSVCIQFGNAESPSSTQSFILKNASETKQKDDEKIVEGGKEGKEGKSYCSQMEEAKE